MKPAAAMQGGKPNQPYNNPTAPQPSKKSKTEPTPSSVILPVPPAAVPQQPVRNLFKNHRMILLENERVHIKFKKWIFQITITKPFKHRLSQHTYPLVERVVKKAIRSLVGFTYDVQNKGFCLAKGTICSENLVFCFGDIKLKEVEVVKYSKAKAAENFSDLSDWISETFFKNNKKDIPNDMQRLLALLKIDHSKENLIRNHLAFMNGRGRRDFICKWWDVVDQYSDFGWQQYILACSYLPNAEDWGSLIDKNGPLYRVYTKRSGVSGDYEPLPREQPRFFRHCLAHLLRYCRMNNKYASPEFYYDDCVNILFAAFPDSITVFPELLDQHNLLRGLRPEAYFYL